MRPGAKRLISTRFEIEVSVVAPYAGLNEYQKLIISQRVRYRPAWRGFIGEAEENGRNESIQNERLVDGILSDGHQCEPKGERLDERSLHGVLAALLTRRNFALVAIVGIFHELWRVLDTLRRGRTQGSR
jgi:hypothetical protein